MKDYPSTRSGRFYWCIFAAECFAFFAVACVLHRWPPTSNNDDLQKVFLGGLLNAAGIFAGALTIIAFICLFVERNTQRVPAALWLSVAMGLLVVLLTFG